MKQPERLGLDIYTTDEVCDYLEFVEQLIRDYRDAESLRVAELPGAAVDPVQRGKFFMAFNASESARTALFAAIEDK